MKKFLLTLTILCVSFLFYQCRKEVSFAGEADPGSSYVTPDPIIASVQGNVLDENDQPAANVSVRIGNQTIFTDNNGYFRVNEAALDQNTTLVTASKDGYFTGYRVFAATSGCNQVVIKLVHKDFVATLPATSGGSAVLRNGATISLPANGVMVASSKAGYAGDVNVFASYIDPNALDIASTVPGSFAANDKEGNRVVLTSFGMLAVQLESSGGEKLQIKEGSTAKLTIPIPANSLANAPETIPLWYVNEETGLWQEEGTAARQGNNYIGDVKHFSYWNCDYPNKATSIFLKVLAFDGSPLVNTPVWFVPSDTTAGAAHGYTDSLGQIKGLVPAGTNLTMKVLSECGDVLYKKTFDPVTQYTDLGTVTVENSSSAFTTFTGTLVNCNNEPVTNGYVLIKFGYIYRYVKTNESGVFKTTYSSCLPGADAFVLYGIDEATQQQSQVLTFTFSNPVLDVGKIPVCGISAEQYINYTLDGIEYKINSTTPDSLSSVIISGNLNRIEGFLPSDLSTHISFRTYAAAAGSYSLESLTANDYSNVQLQQPFTITFTNYPEEIGDYFVGSFAGKFTDSLSAGSHDISATFKVRRTN